MFKLKEKFKTRKKLSLENIYEMLYQSLSLNQEKISKLEIELEEARAKNKDDFWGKAAMEKQLTKEIEKKDAVIQELRDYNQKLYDYAYKLATIIQSEKEKSSETNQKLLDEIAELKSDHYVKVEVPEGKKTKGQRIGVKRSAVTSKIIKKVKEN